MEPSVLTFAGPYIERCAELRAQPAALAAVRADPAARFLPVWQSRCPVVDDRLSLYGGDELPGAGAARNRGIFLGRFRDAPLFAVGIDGEAPGMATDSFVHLRDVLSRLPAAEAAVIAFARAMVNWQERHRHCGVCGARNGPADGGFVMTCTDDGCRQRSFPRLDPAVIMLIHRGDRCLLGRRPDWPAGRFSTIAGFVEPGESLEDAVRREVLEETDVRVGRCSYVASQPWPFPASLMIGFHGEAESEDIRFNDGELVEAGWFSRADIAGGTVRLPPRESVAWHLIAAWFDTAWPTPLRELPEVGSFVPPPMTTRTGGPR